MMFEDDSQLFYEGARAEVIAEHDPHGKAVRHSSNYSNWGTEQKMFDALHREFDFVLDTAATLANRKVPFFFGPDHPVENHRDALKIDWHWSVTDAFKKVRTVFCNPPFSKEEKQPIEPWIEKFWVESQKGLPIVSVLPASIQTRWWQEFVRKSNEIRIIPHRVTYEAPPGALEATNEKRRALGKKEVDKLWGAGHNTAVVIWKPWTGYRPPYEAVHRYWSYREDK